MGIFRTSKIKPEFPSKDEHSQTNRSVTLHQSQSRDIVYSIIAVPEPLFFLFLFNAFFSPARLIIITPTIETCSDRPNHVGTTGTGHLKTVPEKKTNTYSGDPSLGCD